MVALGPLCCLGFSLVSESGGYSLAAMHGLLIAVASLVAERGLWANGLQKLWRVGSIVAVSGL